MRRGRYPAGQPGGLPSQRQLRVGEIIRHALADILAHGAVQDPELERVSVTVPEVRMSPDLRQATVLVMPLGGAGGESVAAALERHRKWLRGQLARRVALKFMPDLRFRADTRFDEASRIDEILHSPQVARDLTADGSE